MSDAAMTLAVVRKLLADGELSGFEARLGRAPGEQSHAGVWAELGAELVGPLVDLLGPLTAIGFEGDAAGGFDAEAVAHLATAKGIKGTALVSRLRVLPGEIVLIGPKGRIVLPLADLESGSTPDITPLTQALQALRTRLVHPWEDPVPTPIPSLAGRKVLVTGGTGFIGARVVEMLAAGGAEVTATVRNRRRAARIGRLNVDLQLGELSDPDVAAELVTGQDVVISLAYDIRRSPAANLKVHRTVAAACEAAGVRRFVHVSSIAVYDGWPGDQDLEETSPSDGPGHDYKQVKHTLELDLIERASAGTLDSVILQPTLVYGPFSALWTDGFVEQFLSGTVVMPAQGLGGANAVYVDDVARALIAAALTATGNAERYIISGAGTVPWAELIDGFGAALGDQVELRDEPPPVIPARKPTGLRAALKNPLALANFKPVHRILALLRERVGDEVVEALREKVMALKGARGGPIVHRPASGNPKLFLAKGVARIDKAREDLGYAPAFDLAAGMARTQAYIRWRWETGDE